MNIINKQILSPILSKLMQKLLNIQYILIIMEAVALVIKSSLSKMSAPLATSPALCTIYILLLQLQCTWPHWPQHFYPSSFPVSIKVWSQWLTKPNHTMIDKTKPHCFVGRDAIHEKIQTNQSLEVNQNKAAEITARAVIWKSWSSRDIVIAWWNGFCLGGNMKHIWIITWKKFRI